MSDLTALVPIKAASERVPGKNLRPFNGKPLLHWVLATLEAAPDVARVVVNTDSNEAAAYARRFSKVLLHERPPHLRGHQVPMNAIIADDLGRLEGEHFLQTHVTNPLLTVATIQRAIDAYAGLLRSPDGAPPDAPDALFSVTPHQCRFYDGAGRALNHDPRALVNTQDLPPLYEENSCLYLFSRQAFLAGGQNRLGTRPVFFPMSRLEAQDIDTEEDFILAEALHRLHSRP